MRRRDRSLTTISLTKTTPAKAKVDALVVGVRPLAGNSNGASGVALSAEARAVDKALGGRLASTVAALGGTGAVGNVTKVAALGALRADLVVAVGLGAATDDTAGPDQLEALRRAAGGATRELAGTATVGLALPATTAAQAQAVAEGALLGAYGFRRYRVASQEERKPPVENVVLITPSARDKAVKAAVDEAATLAAAVHFTRDLVNTPASDLHPVEFADITAKLPRQMKVNLDVEVLDEAALIAGKYGGILGVGQGSTNPPRLVRIAYRHRRAKKHLAFIGKGITFDSGGLSLKTSTGMEWMKADMSGAAAVVAALVAIAQLDLPVNVTGWAPLAENMPSGTAQRPSDVLTMYGGRTVEVLNTDAEGRLVLADAIVRAGEEKPDLLVDIATLTGAQLIALGSRTSAIMANDDDVRSHVHDAATRAGEQMWPMPLPDELRKSMDTEVADIANMGERFGGMLVAGLFLREFVPDGQRWVHLDIAGPSFNEGDAYGYTPKGGTGAGVRTLVQLARDVADGRLSL
jgi:leucyl aminopeptidase